MKQDITLTQSYEIFIPDAGDKYCQQEVESITGLREYIKSISSQLDPDMTHKVSITRHWHITSNQNKLPMQTVKILSPWNEFRDFRFFVVNGKIPTVSDVMEYIKSQKCNVYPAKDSMRLNALAYHEIGFDPNLYLLGNNIVTDMDLKQIRPYNTSTEPRALRSFFGPVTINGSLKLR